MLRVGEYHTAPLSIRTKTVLGPKQGLKLSSVVFGIDEIIFKYVFEVRDETTTGKSHTSSMELKTSGLG
jgi:hypothetical protein